MPCQPVVLCADEYVCVLVCIVGSILNKLLLNIFRLLKANFRNDNTVLS